MEKNRPFGLHLTIDGYGGDYGKLQDLARIWHLLDELPERIGMTKIAPPYVFHYRGIIPEDWGITGVVIIAESHLTIHTFPERRYLSFDAFSCKCFRNKAVELVQTIKDEFDLLECETNLINRGTWYGQQMLMHVPENIFCGGG